MLKFHQAFRIPFTLGASSHFSTVDKHLESCNRFDFFIIFQQIVWFAVPLENNKHVPISSFGFSWNSSSEYFQMNLNVCILHEIFYSLFGLSPGSRSGLSCKMPQDSRWADDEYYFLGALYQENVRGHPASRAWERRPSLPKADDNLCRDSLTQDQVLWTAWSDPGEGGGEW